MFTFFNSIFANGFQVTSVDLHDQLPDVVARFTRLLPNSKEVDWYLEVIDKARKTSQRESISYNDVLCYVNAEITEIGYFDETNNEILELIPTKLFIDFLIELKNFLLKYESGAIPGIIPESKKDEWVIVPKEYVKDEWWGEQDGDN